MPLINGLKMACEPCIRGHRSTKCTHANERLMVPVRKPGRPLSACPHPRDQTCGCGSVTAAIPKKQTCHCGTSAQTPAPVVPRPGTAMSDIPSPTKSTFKIQKNTRPASSRKQSFDPANLERMDMSHVNLQSFEPRPQNIPVNFMNGYTMASPTPVYGFAPQYANMQPQYSIVQMQTHSHLNGMNGTMLQTIGTNGYNNGTHLGLETAVESPLATPTAFDSNEPGKFTNETSYIGFGKNGMNGMNGIAKPRNGGSCCAPQPRSHSSSSSTSSISEPREPQAGGCCSSKTNNLTLKTETPNGTSAHDTPQIPHQVIPPNGMPFNPMMYQQFMPHPTVFTYPPTYGSWQNPLQPSAWREGVRSNYASAEIPMPPGSLPFQAPLVSGSMDTVHTCNCGDTCQCIGCAAHPYNDATQDYVRSAWEMSTERSTTSGEVFTSGHSAPNGNGITEGQTPNAVQAIDSVASPTAQTPSSTTSANGDDQNLSADNFLFVSYPFTGEGCAGEMNECPCGDDCQCLGCTIHGNANGGRLQDIQMPCCGLQDECPCGDQCACIGCEIHKRVEVEDDAPSGGGSCCK